ncbi:unnamed protein product, partial [Cyprideis torosa]
MAINGLYLSAAHKSSGKTTVTIGIGAALVSKGYTVQAFKKGPDYIDPMWLKMATGRGCYNLDFYTQEEDEILELVAEKSQGADLALVEGNKGLYDGLDLDGSNSNAALAKFLKTPVVLVLDTVGTIRGVAPLVIGYQTFDPDVEIAGVILNKVGGPRHEKKLIQVMETYTDVPVIGAVGRSDEVKLLERHLGLIPSNEEAGALSKVAQIGRFIADSVDLDKLVAIAAPLEDAPSFSFQRPSVAPENETIRLGIAKDAAFGFYYEDDLDTFKALDVELVAVDFIHDKTLPKDLDGLFIGGGFPESFLQELSANES